MVDETIRKSVSDYLAVVRSNGIPARFGVIFGSQVTGKADKWSDIDLLVVSSRFDGTPDREDISLLWRLTVSSDNRIEPFAVGEKEWENDDSRQVINVARRMGVLVS